MSDPEAMSILAVRVPPSHKAALATLAQLEAESIATIVRRIIRVEAMRRGVWPESITEIKENKAR
ncbi:MAG: hypothetical protein ACYC5M_10700 [Anaerolineae bacterium]